jgi:hypothetical protein
MDCIENGEIKEEDTQTQTARRSHNANNNFWKELIAYFPFIRHGPHRKPKILGGMHISDLIILVTKIKGEAQTEQGDLINLKSIKN